MGTILVHEFITLDGVIETPTWTFGYGFDPKMGVAIGSIMGPSKAILLGRQTSEEFAPAWSARTGDGGSRRAVHERVTEVRRLRHARRRPSWNNSHIVGSAYQAASEMTRSLKDSIDGSIYVSGSATLVRAMLADGLVDELHLFVYPLALGRRQAALPRRRSDDKARTGRERVLRERRAPPHLSPGEAHRKCRCSSHRTSAPCATCMTICSARRHRSARAKRSCASSPTASPRDIAIVGGSVRRVAQLASASRRRARGGDLVGAFRRARSPRHRRARSRLRELGGGRGRSSSAAVRSGDRRRAVRRPRGGRRLAARGCDDRETALALGSRRDAAPLSRRATASRSTAPPCPPTRRISRGSSSTAVRMPPQRRRCTAAARPLSGCSDRAATRRGAEHAMAQLDRVLVEAGAPD